MPKLIDYPSSTLKNALALAKTVDDMGGRASVDITAEAMGKKVSGAFNSLIASAARYGLIVRKRSAMETTSLYKDYKLAYTSDERDEILQTAFLTPPVFAEIYERFKGKKLPVGHFDKLLVKEFEVPEQQGSRVAKYFIEGAKQTGLMGADNLLLGLQGVGGEDICEPEAEVEPVGNAHGFNRPESSGQAANSSGLSGIPTDSVRAESDDYAVRITGPGMDMLMVAKEPEDLEIIRAMLKKVEKKLVSND